MRVKITLICSSCGNKNYISSKNKATHPEKVETMKFVPKNELLHFIVKVRQQELSCCFFIYNKFLLCTLIKNCDNII